MLRSHPAEKYSFSVLSGIFKNLTATFQVSTRSPHLLQKSVKKRSYLNMHIHAHVKRHSHSNT